MDGARTRGQPAALAAVRAMIRGGAPHAVLLSGPGGVGKTTLAMDLATGLLCTADDPAIRPCGVCRGCRLMASGQHPDLHRLAPDGAGRQIVIGKKDEETPRGIRHLQRDLALLPLEGPNRVAIIESAHRMNDDAQGALLKTLEEPPPGVTIILCAADGDQLLDTVRSRCARVRLGTVGVRDIETILAERGIADAPAAARLARVAGGRPGLAISYANAPDAIRVRTELSRTIVDLLSASPAVRLEAMRTMAPTAMILAATLADVAPTADDGTSPGQASATRGSKTGRTGRTGRKAASDRVVAAETASADSDDADSTASDIESPAKAAPAVLRRRAAETLVTIWIAVARDLALIAAGGARSVADPDLLEELTAAAAELSPAATAAALRHVERSAMLLAANVSPELILDDLALAWPRRRRAA